MRLTPDMKVLCVCRRGQVRSVAARNILADRHGFRRVLACGWENNDAETLAMLYAWADAVLVVGRGREWRLDAPPEKTYLLEVGPDTYGKYDHPDLIALLVPRIEAIILGV